MSLADAAPSSSRRGVAAQLVAAAPTSVRCASRARAAAARTARTRPSPTRARAIDSIAARAVTSPMPGQQHEDAIPAHFVARVLEDAQEREHVLHVRRLEELEAAPLLERDLAVRELDLEVGRHVAGAEEHRDLAQRNAFLVQLENPVDDEARLLLLVLRRDEPRLLAARRAPSTDSS